MSELHKNPEEFKGENKCRYWGAECAANPGTTFMDDYAYDCALACGYGCWDEVPDNIRTLIRRSFKEGQEIERRNY